LALWLALGAKPQAVTAELDLSFSSLMPAAPNRGGGAARPAPVWSTAPSQNSAVAPAPEPAPAQDEALPGPACADCEDKGGGGGDGSGRGAYIPASQAARKPRWVDRFLSPDDYPRVAREAGKDGRVVLSVLLDETGRVRDARLLQGAYEALNEVALRKVREAVFSPAYDASGKAVPCEVTLPIRFELR
jgi:TonB family protein